MLRRYLPALLAILAPVAAIAQTLTWRTLQPGVEFAQVAVGTLPTGKPGRLDVVRIDPARAKLTVALASESRSAKRTAASWCQTSNLAVAINLGMFQDNQLSNVGYLRHGAHVNNGHWNRDNAVLALNPSDPALAKAQWIDRDEPAAALPLEKYDIVVQNLRLITKRRKNVWSASERRWSEAALAIDTNGRLLFLFSRAPWSMRAFNDMILRLPLGVTGAMHLEGGPEASLSIHAGGVDLDESGSFETGFWPDDSNRDQWPIPNVLGVLKER